MIKNKFNVFIAAIIAVFCLMASGAWASAPAALIVYDQTVNVANNTGPEYSSAVSLGDIVISYPSSSDLVPGGKITISAPADMAFAVTSTGCATVQGGQYTLDLIAAMAQ